MTIGRPIEFDPTVALNAATMLFWRKGFEASSLQELIKTMNLSKSSFYQTFQNKHTLFMSCIQSYHGGLVQELRQRRQSDPSAKIFVSGLLYNVVDEVHGPEARRGCLIMNTATEFAQSDGEIAALISNCIKEITVIFKEIIQDAQKHDEISPDKNADALAAYLVSIWSGLRTSVKAGAGPETIRQIVSVALSAFK